MKPGPELDALVASHVMGWDIWRHGFGQVGVITEDETFEIESFRPSKDLKTAWEVVDKFSFVDIRKRPKGYSVEIVGKNGIVSQVEDEVPLAICLAALKAVGSDAK